MLAGVTAASPTAAVARLVGAVGRRGPRRRARALRRVLRGVLHQRLVPAPSGKGRTAQAELALGGRAATGA